MAAHARALLVSTAAGRVEFVHADARKPHSILDDPAFTATINLDEPVGLIMTAVLMCFPDDEAHEIVTTLVDRLPRGSHLVMSHPAAESAHEAQQAAASIADQAGLLYLPRTRTQVAAFVTGLDLVDPGLVPMRSWRRGVQTNRLPRKAFSWAAVARKR